MIYYIQIFDCGKQVNEMYRKVKGTLIQMSSVTGAKLSFHLYTFTHQYKKFL